MTILDTLKDKIMPRPGAPIAPAVKDKLEAAEIELQTLNARLGDLALAEALAEEGADANLDAHRADVAALRYRVEELRAAYNAALARDSAAIAGARASVFKSQVAATRQHFAARDAALGKMSASLAEAIGFYSDALKAGAKAAASCPGEMPPAALVSRGAMDRALTNELYRLSAPLIEGHDAVVAHRLAFAGVRPNDLGMMGTPDKIEPIAVLAARSTEYAIARISGKPLPIEPVTVAAPAVQRQEAQSAAYGNVEPVAGGPVDGAVTDFRNYVMPAPIKMRLSDD